MVARSAKQLAKKFPRIVNDHGLMTIDDLCGIGQTALYRAARAYNKNENPEFAAFARYYVRGAMLNALDALLFEERVQWAAHRAEDNYLGYHAGDDYNVMKHDDAEARRRYRAFANGEVAALEEAQRHLDLAELDERREYEHAITALRAALTRLSEADQKLLALAYSELINLKEAAKALGIPYGTARAHHTRALKILHLLLVDAGITRVPQPLVVPDVAALDARAPPPQYDTTQAEAEAPTTKEPE